MAKRKEEKSCFLEAGADSFRDQEGNLKLDLR